VTYEHCVIMAGLDAVDDEEPLGYRVHQWQAEKNGIVGRSSGIGARKAESHADGLVWARHCTEEIGNWAVFLPQLHALYRVVTNRAFNPLVDLSVAGAGPTLRYANH
jgi:hypothetical protein